MTGPNVYHKQLARHLANLDQLLAEAEEIASDPTDQQQQAARDFIAEFEPTRREVEAKLRGE